MICEPVREHALIGQGGVCQDERHVREAPRKVREWIHPRHPAAGVDQDRDARILCDREDRFGGRIPEPERLRARVELDAAGAAGQAALRFADRVLGRVQSAVGNDPPAAVGAPRQHTIVGAAIARAAVRIVKREGAGPRTRRGLVQKADQRLWAERLPILVGAEVRMGVDDGPVGWSQAGELFDERSVRRSELRDRLRLGPGIVRQGAGRRHEASPPMAAGRADRPRLEIRSPPAPSQRPVPLSSTEVVGRRSLPSGVCHRRRARKEEHRIVSEQTPYIDFENLPSPTEGFLVTQFITVRSVARSRAFYSDVLGGQVVLEENPCMVKLANSWLIMNPGGGPTPDKPDISVVDYEPGSTVSSFLNLRVANIQECYEQWSAKGAEFVTPPIDRGAEIRCYMRDPDGYMIEVGQSTGLLQGRLAKKRPEDLPAR